MVANRLKGDLFENMIVAEFFKKNHHQYLHEEFYFWQDSNANGIDLLSATEDGFAAVEIKATQTITQEKFKNLDKF